MWSVKWLVFIGSGFFIITVTAHNYYTGKRGIYENLTRKAMKRKGLSCTIHGRNV